jgi:phosphoribosyl-ATP pyrophosphohydrolase/phosphoribosyl-AMP cyclohydrolase
LDKERKAAILNLIDIKNDCDNDTLLIQVKVLLVIKELIPVGQQKINELWFYFCSGDTIQVRRENADSEKSYVASLFKLGINKIAQKVGEEAVEVVIEAKDDNDDLFFKRKR